MYDLYQWKLCNTTHSECGQLQEKLEMSTAILNDLIVEKLHLLLHIILNGRKS